MSGRRADGVSTYARRQREEAEGNSAVWRRIPWRKIAAPNGKEPEDPIPDPTCCCDGNVNVECAGRGGTADGGRVRQAAAG